jgi:hypothetical protein
MQLRQHAPNIAIREQEASSRVPSTKASQTLMAELLGNRGEDSKDLPLECAHPTKKANISVAELLENLQGRSGCSVGAASLVGFLWYCSLFSAHGQTLYHL